MGNGDKNIPSLALSVPERGRERGGRQVEESDAQRPRPWDERERKVPGKRTTTKALPLFNGVIPNTLRKKSI